LEQIKQNLSAADEEMFRNIGSAGFTISSSPRPDVELVRYLYNRRSSDVKTVIFAPNGGWVALSSNGHPTYSNIPKSVAALLRLYPGKHN
jgi:hypothetical protein